jgi:hypothetical protein
MKSKVMMLIFLTGFVSTGWGQTLKSDSVRFESGDLCATVRGDVSDLQLSTAFLAPGQDPSALAWSTRKIRVRDAVLRVPLKDWFSKEDAAGGILLLRAGSTETIWGVRQLHLVKGENWIGTWGPLSSARVVLPKGVEGSLPDDVCQPMSVKAGEKHGGATGWVVMPFEEGGTCAVHIPVDQPATAFCLPGLRAWSLEDLGLIEAGFQGGANPVLSDRIWKLNPLTRVVDATFWFRSTDQTWRRTSKGFPAIKGDLFFPGDVLVIKPRVSTKDWVLNPGSN